MDESKLKEKLLSAIEAETTMAVCYGRIAELIENNKMKSQFNRFSKEAGESKELLCSRLASLGVAGVKYKSVCLACKLKPESFSLIGAIELGIETTKVAEKFYKELSAKCDSQHDKELFKALFKGQIKRRSVLKRERKFGHTEEDSPLLTYCIPEVLFQLWK